MYYNNYQLLYSEGEPKSSKSRASMKWWSRCIYMAVIAKTASRNVAFKVARMREAIMQDQDEFITRNANLRTLFRKPTTGLFWRI